MEDFKMTNTTIYPGTLVFPKEGSLFKKELDIRSQDNTTILAKKAGRPYVVLSPSWVSKFLGVIWIVPQKSLSSFNVKNRVWYADESDTLRELLVMQMITVEVGDVTVSPHQEALKAPTMKAIKLLKDQLDQALSELNGDPVISNKRNILKDITKPEVTEESTPVATIETTSIAPVIDVTPTEVSTPTKKKHTLVDKELIYEELRKGTPRKEICTKYGISNTTLMRRESEYRAAQNSSSHTKPTPKKEEDNMPYMAWTTTEFAAGTDFMQIGTDYRGGYHINKPPLRYPNLLKLPKKLQREAKAEYLFVYQWNYDSDFCKKYQSAEKAKKRYDAAVELLNTYGIQMP